MVGFNAEHRILVTGASSGIGRATALLLNSLGATVIANGRNEERLSEVKALCARPDSLIVAPRDLTRDMETVPVWVRFLAKEYGKLAGLACVAGISEPMSLQLFNVEEAQRVFTINYYAPMLLAQGFTDRRANIGKGASLVFVASIAGVQKLKGQVAYTGSKGALISSARGISLETAASGVRVNCISPGLIETPMTATENLNPALAGILHDEARRMPLGLGRAEDVANLIAFLLSDASGWITGQNFVIDGGRD